MGNYQLNVTTFILEINLTNVRPVGTHSGRNIIYEDMKLGIGKQVIEFEIIHTREILSFKIGIK